MKQSQKIKQRQKKKESNHLIKKKIANLYILLSFPMGFQPKQTDEPTGKSRRVLGVLHPFQQLKAWPGVDKPWRPKDRLQHGGEAVLSWWGSAGWAGAGCEQCHTQQGAAEGSEASLLVLLQGLKTLSMLF